MASWRKLLVARLPPPRSRFWVSFTPCGFRDGQNGVWEGFYRSSSGFFLLKVWFHHFSTFMSFISFHLIFLIYVMVRQAQAVSRSPPTAEVESLGLVHSMWVSRWTKRGLGRFLSEFLRFFPTKSLIPPFLHFHVVHFIPLNFFNPCDGASGVVGRHYCYLLTVNLGSSSISPLPPTLCQTRVEDES